MDTGLIIDRTFDRRLINFVALACLNDIVEDGTSEQALANSVDETSQIWAEVRDKKQILGLVQFKAYNRSILEIHPFVLPEHRNRSEDVGKSVIAWVTDYTPETYRTLITNIPSCKRYAALFARKLGFKQVGRYEDGFYKDGEHHDMMLYQRSIRNG